MKALMVVLVPALALLAVAGLGLFSAAGAAAQAGETVALAKLGASAAEMTDALQAERVAVTAVLSPGSGPQERTGYEERIGRSDAVAERFTRLRGSLPRGTARVDVVLARVDGALADVAGQRLRVRAGQPVALSTSTFSYRIAIAALIDYREAVSQGGVDADLAGQLRAGAQLSRAKEAIGLEQVSVLQALAAGGMSPALAQTVVAARAAFTDAAETFQRLALPQWLPVFQQSLTGTDVLDAAVLAGTVTRTGTAAAIVLPGGSAAWNRVMTGRAAQLRTVEARVDDDVIAAAGEARTRQLLQAGLQGGLSVLALVLAMVVTALVTRSIVRPIQRLQAGARHVGETLLPRIANELRFVASLGEAQQRTDRAAAAARLEVSGRDEIGQLATVFNTLIGGFVHASGKLAEGRITSAGQVTTLARRVQSLIDQLLLQLDGLEQEADPTLLSKLFDVDNRAARLRRLVANLLVLSGSGTGRAHRHAEPLLALVRAAASEIEHYQWVAPGVLPEVRIDPRAVLSLKQILAELLDNATVYGPRKGEVHVGGQLTLGRLVLSIADRGVISPERLAANNKLLQDPGADLGLLHQMGLAVVARLAQPLGIVVHLERRADGTTAWVQIPLELVRQPGEPAPALPAAPATATGPAQLSQQTWPPAPLQRPDARPEWRPKHAREDESPDDVTQVLPVTTPAPAAPSRWLSGEALTGEHRPERTTAADEDPPQTTEAGLPKRPTRPRPVPGPPQANPPAASAPRDPAVVAAHTAAVVRALRQQSAYNTIPRQEGRRDASPAVVAR